MVASQPESNLLFFAVSEVRCLIEDLQARSASLSIKELLERVIRATEYKAYLSEDHTPEAQSRLENIDELVSSAAQFQRECEH